MRSVVILVIKNRTTAHGYYSYDYRPNWTLLSPITTIYIFIYVFISFLLIHVNIHSFICLFIYHSYYQPKKFFIVKQVLLVST